DLKPPPSSGDSTSSFLPPPPAQLVAALAEFETSGPGPESFRRSVPDFTPPDAPIGAPDSRAKPAPREVDAPPAAPARTGGPAIDGRVAGVVGAVALVAIGVWALFFR